MQAQERSRLRGLTRTDRGFRLPPCPIGSKKGAQLPPLWTMLLTLDPEDPTSTTLELDERMARLSSKSARLLDVDVSLPWEIGAGKTCRQLWETIAEGYRQGHCFTDLLKVYASVIRRGAVPAVGKETGETAHVERWKNTLRQRLARFVRMT